MDTNLSGNSAIPPVNNKDLNETASLSSPPSNSAEPARFDNHTLTTESSCRKRIFSPTVFTDSTNSPHELRKHKISRLDQYTWNPEEEKAIHDEMIDEDHFLRPNEYIWNPEKEKAVHDEMIDEDHFLRPIKPEFQEELDTATLNGEEDLFKNWSENESIYDQQAAPAPGHTAASHGLKSGAKNELSRATSAIMAALEENPSLSHAVAMEVVRTTLIHEHTNPRTLEEKAFKIVMQVFNKLLQKNPSPTSPDAHLKNQDRFYDTDVQQALDAGLSKKNAYKDAILRAGQRSFYFNPNQNRKEAQNQARTGMGAARDYLVVRKGVSPSLLPSIEELLSEMGTRSIMTH